MAEDGKKPRRTITIWGEGHTIELQAQGYETHNAVIVDLQIAMMVVSKKMADAGKTNIILPGSGAMRSN